MDDISQIQDLSAPYKLTVMTVVMEKAMAITGICIHVDGDDISQSQDVSPLYMVTMLTVMMINALYSWNASVYVDLQISVYE